MFSLFGIPFISIKKTHFFHWAQFLQKNQASLFLKDRYHMYYSLYTSQINSDRARYKPTIELINQKFTQKISKTTVRLHSCMLKILQPPSPTYLSSHNIKAIVKLASKLHCLYVIEKHSKHELSFVCLWKSGTLSLLNTMFSCTLQTISTKIILLTSTLHPRTAGSLHTVNFGGSRASPLTQSDQPRPVTLQSACILQKKCCHVFSMS